MVMHTYKLVNLPFRSSIHSFLLTGVQRIALSLGSLQNIPQAHASWDCNCSMFQRSTLKRSFPVHEQYEQLVVDVAGGFVFSIYYYSI